jgi:hypothetical protein
LATPAAHLDEGEQVILLSNYVDLALAESKVAFADAVSLRKQVLNGKALTEIA